MKKIRSFMLAFALILVGCSTNGQTAVDVVDIATTVEQVVEVEESTTTTAPTTIPKATSTVLATTTSTTTTIIDPNTDPVPGDCLVVEQQYCDEMLVVVMSDGDTGANLKLPAGEPLFAPFTGTIGVTGDPQILVVYEDETENYLSLGYTGKLEPGVEDRVTKGQIFARTGEADFKTKDNSVRNLGFAFVTNGRFTATPPTTISP